MLANLGYALVSCLILNDALKVAMIRWRVPNAASRHRYEEKAAEG
jgi:hypothetical protein